MDKFSLSSYCSHPGSPQTLTPFVYIVIPASLLSKGLFPQATSMEMKKSIQRYHSKYKYAELKIGYIGRSGQNENKNDLMISQFLLQDVCGRFCVTSMIISSALFKIVSLITITDI